MSQTFKLHGIDGEQFAPLFDLSNEQLLQHRAVRRVAAHVCAYPCRVSLEDAQIGDELLLLPYVHQPAASPYCASGPIYVRRGAIQRVSEIGEVPNCVTNRVISLRAYDGEHLMIDANVCDGTLVASEITRLFGNDAVDYIHLHYAKRGCFACRVDRA